MSGTPRLPAPPATYSQRDQAELRRALETFLTSVQGLAGTFSQAQADLRYSLLGHTHSFASLTSIPTTIGGYGITDFNSLGDARWSLLGHTHSFASLTSIPTTIAGYGITDLNSLGDARWLKLTGGTLTGNLLFSTDGTLDIGASGATRPRTIWLTAGWDMNDGTVRATGIIEASRLDFGTVTNHDFGIFTNSTLRFRLTSSGHFVAHTDNSFDIGATGANRPRDLYLAGQLKLEGTAPAIRFTNSVANGAGTNSHNANVAPTGAASTIQGWLKISVNGTDRFLPFW